MIKNYIIIILLFSINKILEMQEQYNQDNINNILDVDLLMKVWVGLK